MSYENIIFEKKGKIGYVTINRPKVLNALNRAVMTELNDVFSKIKDDSEVFAVILTGAGEKSFVAGADINELAVQGPVEGADFALWGQGVLNLIENLGKPVIAAVNGFALGGGCELAMACNIRIASENAKFGQPEVNLGIIPGYGGTQRLPRLVGKGRALELILTGELIGADEAYRIGLVNKVVPLTELMSSAEKMANTILSKGPIAVKFAIEAVNHGLSGTLAEGLLLEARLFGLIASTEDKIEGTKAFIEKRKTEFKGK